MTIRHARKLVKLMLVLTILSIMLSLVEGGLFRGGAGRGIGRGGGSGGGRGIKPPGGGGVGGIKPLNRNHCNSGNPLTMSSALLSSIICLLFCVALF